MTEEQLTKSILDWLCLNNWTIISFDFPQSGTGILIKPNTEEINSGSSNFKNFIPDIIAHKDKNVVFFENKNRFVLNDFNKIHMLKNTDVYYANINKVLTGYPYNSIYYGIAIPFKNNDEYKLIEHLGKVDFIILNQDPSINVYYNPHNIPFIDKKL